MDLQEISGLIGIIISVVTVIIWPTYKFIRRGIAKKVKQEKQVSKNEKDIAEVMRSIASLNTSVASILHNQDIAAEKQTKEQRENIEREIRDIKVYINMIYYSYTSITDIPNEMFINGFNLCQRYIALGQNHEMEPICKAFTKEHNRRVSNKLN